MLKKITRINPLQLGKVSAVIYGFFSLLFMLFMLIPTFLSKQPGPKIIFILAIPIFYIVAAFVMAVITALIYNLCAKWIGGIEIELED